MRRVLLFFFFVVLYSCSSLPHKGIDSLSWKTVKWNGQVYQVDTVRNAFFRLAGREENLHLYFKSISDTIIDTPLCIFPIPVEYKNEEIIIVIDTLENGVVEKAVVEADPDPYSYSYLSLLLDGSYEELTDILSSSFSQKTAKRLSDDHTWIIIDLLVDDNGSVIEASQQIYSETLIYDKSVLRSFAKLDRTIKESVRFNDDGRFRRLGIPYGWTRLNIEFVDGKEKVSGLSYQHPR